MPTATSIVTGVDFVSVPTQNLSAAMDFYRDVVGLEQSKLWQRPGQEPLGAEFETGTVTIAIIDVAKLGIDFQPNKVPIAFHVEDVESARAELESRGVSFRGDTIDSGVCHQALFEDPDGNSLDIHNRYAPPDAVPS
jgi:predicted enzyme related to lactoylglutathione lyase